MVLNDFYRNAALTAESTTFPIIVISPVVLSTSYYLYRLYDIASLSHHYAFVYHLVASPFVVVPFALSMRERARFEDLGYSYRWNAKAVWTYTCYSLVTSILWAYIWAYLPGKGAYAEALNVSIGWCVLMGVNLVPLWYLARPQDPEQQLKEGST